MAESFLAKFTKEKTYELPGLTMRVNNDYDEGTVACSPHLRTQKIINRRHTSSNITCIRLLR
jgi:hypothetical protein